MKRFFGITVMMSLLAVSCQEELDNGQVQAPEKERDLVYMEFTAAFEEIGKVTDKEDSRTWLDDESKAVLWDKGDKLSIFPAGQANTTGGDLFETQDNMVSAATFKGSSALVDKYYAFYPYSNKIAVSEDGLITFNFPKTKSFNLNDDIKTGTFPDGYNYSVGVAEDGVLSLQNVASLIKITIPEDDEKLKNLYQIMVQGYDNEIMAGDVVVDAATGEVVEYLTAAGNDSSAAILQIKDENGQRTTFVPGATYYLPTLPMTFKRALKMKLEYNDGTAPTYMFKGCAGMKLERNKVLNIKRIGYYETFMMYDFEDGQKPVDLAGNTGGSLIATSVMSIADNPYPTDENPSKKVFMDDLGARTTETSGRVEMKLTASSVQVKFPYAARRSFDKIRIKVYLGENDYCPYLRLKMSDGGDYTRKAAKVNGIELELDSDGKRIWDKSLIKTDDWNVLEYYLADYSTRDDGFNKLDLIEFKPMCNAAGSNYPGALNTTTNTRIVYFDDIEFLYK